jgi:hypothetical protein
MKFRYRLLTLVLMYVLSLCVPGFHSSEMLTNPVALCYQIFIGYMCIRWQATERETLRFFVKIKHLLQG